MQHASFRSSMSAEKSWLARRLSVVAYSQAWKTHWKTGTLLAPPTVALASSHL